MSIMPWAIAQDRLEIASFLNDGIEHAPQAQVTTVSITGKQLKQHNLSIYRSISVTGDQELTRQIERAVTHDGAKADSREVSFKDGRLYFGFYTLPPHDKENRYIFYLNSEPTGGNKTTLIYIQGKASPEKIQEMLKR